MNPKVIVTRINLDHVYTHDKILFNTNNHYVEEGICRPEDYDKVLAQGNTINWIDRFHTKYHKIILDHEDLLWMKKAFFEVGSITGKFSHLYDEELSYTCKKYNDQMPKGGWFVRTDYVSLKEGMYGSGPYDSFEKVIKSMCTTSIGHECFKANDTTCTIYFLEWIDINPDKEFRIFVHQNEITSMSAQHIYTINNWLNTLSDEQIVTRVYKILDFFDKHIRDKMTYKTNYVMDLALVGEDDTPYFIEPNSFGKYYAAGSALYHWVYDHDKLHENDTIELRYVNEY